MLNNYIAIQKKKKAVFVLLMAVLFVIVFVAHYKALMARAEEVTTTGWVMCKSYLNVRMAPSKTAMEVGRLDPGDAVELDGRTKDGWAHIVGGDFGGDGWIWAGYIVFDEPAEVNDRYTVTGSRVACRKWTDGPQIPGREWILGGSEVKVYWISDEWALTSRGYIMSQYLEVSPL